MRHTFILAAALFAVSETASAQTTSPPKEPELGASNNTELSVVMATGNARSTSVGLRNLYTFRWANAELKWETGWLRADSRDGDRFAVQSASGFDVVEPGTATDSHRMFSKLGYQRQLSRTLDWFANFDAVRDEPSNINRQVVLAGGLGTTWQKTERRTFRTSYGLSYTTEDLVVEGENSFAGYRLAYDLRARLAEATRLESNLTTDGSFETGDDIRMDWLNGVSVAINNRVALKSSVRVLYRNLPALESLALRTPEGATIGSVDVPKKKTDMNLTTSLVITF